VGFPVLRAGEIPAQPDARPWLIENLWSASAAGFLSGPPKSCKSWLGLELAVSVATGGACLGHYPVRERGPALLYLAEDSLTTARERLACLARHRGLALRDLDVYLITVPRLRLDHELDRARLLETARALQPTLLLLDPFVRLHQIDENSATEISALLADLRHLQRTLDLALVIVHHARKNGPGRGPAGQALRGSSDLWAFGDSNLYLRRQGERLPLSIEHRSAPAPAPVCLRLVDSDPEAVHLEIDTACGPSPASPSGALAGAVLDVLQRSPPQTRAELRRALRVNNARLGQALLDLAGDGQIERGPNGWTVVPASGA
jgi:hypothetical protein